MDERSLDRTEPLEKSYVQLYDKANDIRAEGDLEKARAMFTEAHSKVESNSNELDDQWRRCASLDMVIRCETDLQVPASEVIETMCRYSAEIEKIYSSVYGQNKFKVPLNPRSIAEIKDFISFVTELPDKAPDDLDDDSIKANWLLFYYISRWAFVARIYFIRCTSQLDLAHQCGILSEYAAEKSRECRNQTGELVEGAAFVLKEGPKDQRKSIRNRIFDIVDFVEDLLNLNEDSRDPFLKKLAGVQDWVDSHSVIQSTLKRMAEGDYDAAAKDFLLLEEKIERMKHTDNLGEEYKLQLKAKRYYAQACISEEHYDQALIGLRMLFITNFTKFPKVAQEIKIFEARAALRYSRLEDAQNAFRVAKIIIGNVKTSQNGIFDGWLNLIEAEIALLRNKEGQKPAEKSKILLACSKLGDLCPEFVQTLVNSKLWNIFNFEDEEEILELNKIKDKFSAYSIEESVINRPRAEYLPLEAQRLFVLGKLEIEQLKEEYDHDKYLNGVAYLLNAYSILLELDSKDKLLLSQIETAYKEILRINYVNSRFSEERITNILDNLNIEEVAKRNQLEQWTKALLRIIKAQKLASKEDCEDDFSATLVRIIPPFVPSASNIKLIKRNELPRWKLRSNDEFSVIREGTIEKDGKKIYVTTLSLNTHDEFNHDDHTIVIESAHELTKYTKGSLMMIATALEKALKIHSLYKNSEGKEVKDRQRLYDLSGPLTDTLLDEATIEHKARIQEFIRIFCDEWNSEHKDMLNMSFDTSLLVNYARHHDTGKSESPLIVLFKPGALNDPEFDSITNHPPSGAEILCGLLGFDEVVKLEMVHHIQEGNRKGYPWDLKGRKYQEQINDKLADHFEALTDEEKAKLRERPETLQGKRNKDVALSFDIFEAMNAKTRAYRDELTLQDLVGFAISNIGINFPHYLVHAFVRYVNKGVFNELISHGKIPNGVKNEFELPVSYQLDDVIRYIEMPEVGKFIQQSGLDQSASVRGLSGGRGCGVAMSKECIRAEMFGGFMRTMKINAKETEEQYGKICDQFVSMFEGWIAEQGKHSLDEYYGANGYSDKDVQDASNGNHESVPNIGGSK
ncbi:hypothetical protein ACFL3T_01770 [Patescibacteria group bacterium]